MDSSKNSLTRRGIHDLLEHQSSSEYEEEDENKLDSELYEDESKIDHEVHEEEWHLNIKGTLKKTKLVSKKGRIHEGNTLKKPTHEDDSMLKKISNEESHKESNLLKNSLIIFSIVAILPAALYFSNTEENVEIRDVLQLIGNLKKKFNNQPDWTYKILSSALKKVVNDTAEPSAPAIITVLENENAAGAAKMFCTEVAKLLVSGKHVMIDDSIYGQGDENEIKEKIDKKIKSKVKSSSLNVVVVDQVEKIPLNATMIFHNYCDHDNAHFKRVVYMFVLSLNEDLNPKAKPRELDYVAMEHYRKTWQHAHPDYIESLITRLTVDVINIS